MRISDAAKKSHPLFALAACLSLALAPFASQAKDGNDTQTTPYEWSANLVSFDQETNTAVLQAMVASHVTIDGLDSLKDGDRLILTWSGRSFASGIRGLARDPELTPDSLSLPVEFVSSERNGRYINFRIPVPENAAETIAGFDEGQRVTGMSPRMASDWHNGVISLRHYNDLD